MTDHIPNSFYEDEVRCGFYVSSFAKRWWAAQISVMEEFARVCEENGLNWCAGYGTLIGAVRHKGYIPWDDDIDLFMSRQDYEKFRSIFETSFPSDWKLLSCYNGYTEWNLRLNNGELIHDRNLEKYNYYPFVAGLDIFPIDFIPKDEKIREDIRQRVTEILKSVKKREDNKEVCEAFCKIDQILIECSTKAVAENPEEYYSCIYAYTYSKTRGNEPFWPYDAFVEKTSYPFEYSKINVPKRFNEILSITFGDYMTPRKYVAGHEYPLYGYSLKCWKEAFGKDFLRYSFSKEDLLPGKRMINSTPKQKIEIFVDYTERLHAEIKKDITQKNTETTMDKLISCQDLAVWLGQSIEKEEYYLPLVRKLEGYCEELFVQGEKIKEREGKEFFLDQIILEAKKYVAGKKKVVFLVRRKEDWSGTIRELWESLQRSSDYDVRVAVVPYYYIDSAGNVVESKEELEEFCTEIKVEPAEEIDFVIIHPDVIVTQMPFDGFNYAYSIPEKYYTNRIKENTQKLIYIPPFVTDDFDEKEACSYLTMDYYCTASGVVNADNTVVQSEKMREMYVDKLVDFSKEDRDLWMQKIISKENVWSII